MQKRSTKERCKAAGLRLLSVRARSRAQLRQRLIEKGFEAGIVDQILADFKEMRLIDDREFARAWVESRLRYRPAGTAKLMWELRRQGIGDEIAAPAVRAALDGEKEARLALELAQAKLRLSRFDAQSKTTAERNKEIARIGRFLAGRGFSYQVVRQVINIIKEEATDEP